jgi:hypothetical protein
VNTLLTLLSIIVSWRLPPALVSLSKVILLLSFMFEMAPAQDGT